MYFTEIIARERYKSLIEEENRIRIIGAARPEKTLVKNVLLKVRRFTDLRMLRISRVVVLPGSVIGLAVVDDGADD
jgi:hypothetical protein